MRGADYKRMELALLQKKLISKQVPPQQIEDVERRCLVLMDELDMPVSSFYRHVPRPTSIPGVQLNMFK